MPWRDEGDKALPPPRPSEPTNLRADILDELADHLALAAEREREEGESSEESAWARVLKRFSGPNALARRLWWDAMRETVMREWTQTSAIVVDVVAVLLFVALGFRQMQATNLAVLEALDRQSSEASALFSTVDISIHRGATDGPPAEGMQITMTGKWFGEDTIAVHEKTDSNGSVSLGPIRQGKFGLNVDDPDSGLRFHRDIVLFGGHKDITIIAPNIETTRVSLDLGLPSYTDDEHQLVHTYLKWEWNAGDDAWKSYSELYVGSEGMWELTGPSSGASSGRGMWWIDRLGRMFLASRDVHERGDRVDLQLPHETRLRVIPFHGAIAIGDENSVPAYFGDLNSESDKSLYDLTKSLKARSQEFVVGEGPEQQFEVSLPRPFLDTFTREARLHRDTADFPNLIPMLVRELELDFDRKVSVETIKVPLIGVAYAEGETPGSAPTVSTAQHWSETIRRRVGK